MRLASKLCAHTLRLGLELDLSRQQVTSIKEQHRASPPEDAAFYVLDVRVLWSLFRCENDVIHGGRRFNNSVQYDPTDSHCSLNLTATTLSCRLPSCTPVMKA